MTQIDITTDLDELTLLVESRWTHPVERVWQLWADPQKLQRWWGPEGYPATVHQHDLAPGGEVRYYMTGPDGTRYHGMWDVLEVDAPKRFLARDAFCGEDGEPNRDMPTSTMEVRVEDAGDGQTTMTVFSRYPSRESLEQVIEMGIETGLRSAMGQIEDILAEDAA